jgi:hypothetical protein
VEERRNAVRRPARALIAAAAGAAACAFGAAACELPAGVRIDAENLAVSYRTIPSKVAVGQPFVLELAACPKRGMPMPERAKLDAHMPEHRHGMNYRIKVVSLGAGRFRSEGWMFHMPGRWEFVFDLGPARLTHSVRIE